MIFLGLLITGIVYRCLWLSTIPGLNGDEAWPVVQVQRFLMGEPMTWMTPSNRLLSPFYASFIALAGNVFPNEIVSARVPAVLSGILTILLAYTLFKPIHGKRFATIFSLLLCCSPVMISYSRIGWEPSQIALAGVIALNFSLRKQVLFTWLAFFGAVMTHSVNYFLAPFLFLPLFVDLWKKDLPFYQRAIYQLGHLIVLAGVGILIAKPEMPNLLLQWNQGRPISSIVTEIFLFVPLTLYFLSGLTSYAYFAGQISYLTQSVHELFASGLLFLTVFFALPSMIKDKTVRLYFLSFLVSFVALVNFGTLQALFVGQERYALFLVVPCLYLFAHAIFKISFPKAEIIAYSLCSLWLVTFGYQYFVRTHEHGNLAHRTYATGRSEPKKAAFARAKTLLQKEPEISRASFIVEDYWLYWSFEYFGLRAKSRPIVQTTERWEELLRGGSVLVGFTDGPFDKALKSVQLLDLKQESFPSFDGSPVVKIWYLAKDANS